ncbi:uncharacterized protein LOC124656081 isoform X1 [Lolium rigidum]|uniref:uncharacterized protein LOC124656081 isoform X1 n=1 Tax=Lolium rigidum TaxID=89674 RepID=UPI001F5C904B|nr:uncharacterized protein LOC124656081 isoform X1 [Lolium rigidum]
MTHLWYLLVPSSSIYVFCRFNRSCLRIPRSFGWNKQLLLTLTKCLSYLVLSLGLSPLICAIYGTAPKRIVELLLDRGAKPDIPSTEGFTVLHVLATKQDPFGIADILLSRGANVDSMSSEGTPLHFAAHCGNLEMMEVLLKYGANPNRVVQSSYAPLTLALFASSFKCVELVIQGGADVNAARPVTPLIIAAKDGLSDCIECLLEARADPNIPDEIGRMPVEIAAIHGRKECVDILFPVTSPVAKFADWSIDGIMQHVKSGSSEDHLHTIVQAAFKAQGDAAFERKDYAQASALYTRIEHQQSIIMQNISSETVLDDLPESVVISDILVRLPAEDILRCRVVRKSWHHATSTHDFLLAHHRRQPSLPVIEHIKHGGQLFDRHLFVYFDASPGAASRKLSQKTILWYPDPCLYKDNLVIHGSCDGLLVVSVTEGYFDVCNPITRQRVPLALTCDHDDGLPVTGIRIAGFYQHLASEEYRVLYSICTRNEDTSKVDFHVLAVGCSQSRRITEPPLQQGFLDGLTCSKNAPVLNHGNLHWLLPRYYTSDDFSNIIVFDTKAETFSWMRSPPCKYSWSWMSLLELDGALAMCSSHDGIAIAINVMHDYKAEVWAPTYKINLSALEPSPQLYLPARLHKIATFNERELLIELPGCVLHCDLDGKFLGKMKWDENTDTRLHITSFRFQENIVPLPFFGMREYYGDNFMPEDEDYYEMKYSIW